MDVALDESPITALLIEDNPGDARLVMEALAESGRGGFQIEQTDRLETALERLSRNGVDVVLLDLSLPGSSGLDTLRRTNAAAPALPIVVLTGVNDDGMARDAIGYGAQDYLVKGQIHGEVLVRAIRYAIERKRADERIRREVSYLQLQQVVAAAANEASSVEQAIQTVIDLACAFQNWPVGHAFLITKEKQQVLQYTDLWRTGQSDRYGPFQKATRELRYQPGMGLLSATVTTGKPSWLANLADSPVFLRAEAAKECGLRSGFAMPVMVGNEVLAVLEFFSDKAETLDKRFSQVMDYAGTQLGRVFERKRARDEVDRIFTLSLDMMCLADYDGFFKRINPAFQAILGYTPEELLSKPFADFVHPDDRAETAAVMSRLIQGETVFAFENRYHCKDGSIRWLQWNSTAVPHEQLIYSTARDVTEKKGVEESMRLLGSVVQQSKDSILVTDTELDKPGPRILFVNPAFTRMTGYEAGEVLGKTPRLLQGPRTDAALLRRLRETLERGEAFEGETINYRKDGTEFHIEWQVSPIRDYRGKTTHFMAIQRDVTERKQLEGQLLQASKTEAIGRLAGGVAHDFNNILTAIMGYSELMQQLTKPEDPIQGHLAEVLGASQRAAGLTRQLLAFSRKQVLEPKILNLNDVVANLSKMLRRVIGEDIEMSIVAGPHLGCVKADPTQVEQVLLNMVVNARDAMPQGGRITIETSNLKVDESCKLSCPQVPAGSYVLLAISDTGMGMSAEVKTRIFEPFFTTKEKGKGTGLGLATCFGIVKQSGGHIGVSSEVGKGTTFKVLLPRVDQAVDAPVAQTTTSSMPRGTETVLLVEDEIAVRQFASMALSKLGYTVLQANNGVEALRLVEGTNGRKIDVLVSDVVMPQMGGRELADKLSASYPGLKILFASGYTEDTIGSHGVMDEGFAFLQKPYTTAVLARKIREVLDVRR